MKIELYKKRRNGTGYFERSLKTADGTLRIKIPSCLNELTIGQMIALQENPHLNDIGAISILSGIATEQLQNIIHFEELQAFTAPVTKLSNEIKTLYDSDDVPKKVTFSMDGKSKIVFVTGNLSVEPAGAFMAAREIIAGEINDCIVQYGEEKWKDHFNPSLKACCQVLAHYFYCRVTGNSYNEYAAESFCEEIKKLRVTEALPIAKHFFTCYPSLSKRKTGCLHRLQQFLKSGQVYRRLKGLSISTP